MDYLGEESFVPATFDVLDDLKQLALALVIIGVLDLACQFLGWFPEKKSNARYFSLHVIVNGFVTAIHFKVSYHL
jgi:hypothetical protein